MAAKKIQIENEQLREQLEKIQYGSMLKDQILASESEGGKVDPPVM
jgi:hypothetical protein